MSTHTKLAAWVLVISLLVIGGAWYALEGRRAAQAAAEIAALELEADGARERARALEAQAGALREERAKLATDLAANTKKLRRHRAKKYVYTDGTSLADAFILAGYGHSRSTRDGINTVR